MANQLNLYSDISSFVNTVWADAMLVARENAIMPSLVTVFADRNNMALRKNSTWGTATINQIAEADDLTSQAFTPSVSQTLTPYEYGAQFFITDMREDNDIYAVRQAAATELGLAYGQKVDTALVGLFSSLSAGTVGGSGTALSFSTFEGAIVKARANFIPRPWVAVLHPYQWYSLGTSAAPGVTVTNAPAIQDEILNRYFVGNLMGVDVYLDANITSGAGAKGAIFSAEAMALDIRRAPRIEPERDASRRGYELNFSAIYAYGVWRPTKGICIVADALAPA